MLIERPLVTLQPQLCTTDLQDSFQTLCMLLPAVADLFPHLYSSRLLPPGPVTRAQRWLGKISKLLCYLVSYTKPSSRRSVLQPWDGASLINLSFLRYCLHDV